MASLNYCRCVAACALTQCVSSSRCYGLVCDCGISWSFSLVFQSVLFSCTAENNNLDSRCNNKSGNKKIDLRWLA